MESGYDDLNAVLEEVLRGLTDPANHYMVSASYFKYISSNNQDVGEHFIAIVYLHQECAWNLMLSEKNLYMDVLLNPILPLQSRIRLPLKEIWMVQKSDSNTFTDAGRLFYSESVFKNMLSLKND